MEGEREAKGDRAEPRAVDCSGLIAAWSAFVVAKDCWSVHMSVEGDPLFKHLTSLEL